MPVDYVIISRFLEIFRAKVGKGCIKIHMRQVTLASDFNCSFSFLIVLMLRKKGNKTTTEN